MPKDQPMLESKRTPQAGASLARKLVAPWPPLRPLAAVPGENDYPSEGGTTIQFPSPAEKPMLPAEQRIRDWVAKSDNQTGKILVCYFPGLFLFYIFRALLSSSGKASLQDGSAGESCSAGSTTTERDSKACKRGSFRSNLAERASNSVNGGS